eukprot:70871-Hanusia_phi.AAC.1
MISRFGLNCAMRVYFGESIPGDFRLRGWGSITSSGTGGWGWLTNQVRLEEKGYASNYKGGVGWH